VKTKDQLLGQEEVLRRLGGKNISYHEGTYHTTYEPGSEPLLAWNRASWVQKTCLPIQAALLREAPRSFHRGLHECFEKDYEHLFDSPQHSRIDNDVSGLSPIYILTASFYRH